MFRNKFRNPLRNVFRFESPLLGTACRIHRSFPACRVASSSAHPPASPPALTLRFAVLSTGHAGSTWACEALNALGYRTVHEPLTYLIPPGERARLSQSPDAPDRADAFARWNEWARRSLAEVPVLGEVHTATPWLWIAAASTLPERRVLLMRHPVQVVHSVSRADRTTVLPVLRSTGLVGPDHEPTDAEVFECACRIWAAQTEVVDVLPNLSVFRLRDITSDPSQFADFIEALVGERPSLERSAPLARRVVNRKSEGRRPPEQIYWSWWSDRERARFGTLCGDGMQRFGYVVPPRPTAIAEEPSAANERGCIADWLLPCWEIHTLRQTGPVVVIGEGRRAVEAACEFGGRGAWLLRSDARPWAGAPSNVRVAAFASLPNDVAAIFSIDASEDDPDLAACRARYPSALWVPAFPHDGPDAPLDASEFAPPTPETVLTHPDAETEALGISLGADLGGWQVAAVTLRSGACVFRLRRGPHECDAVVSATPGPVSVGDRSVTYERSNVAFDDLRAGLQALASAVEAWAAGRSVGELLPE